MTKPAITTLDLPALDEVFDMSGGYVLDFSNRTFAMFFAENDVDIDRDFPDGGKAKRLQAFLRSADPAKAAAILEALLECRGVKDGDATSKSFAKVRALVARLRGTGVVALPAASAIDVLSLAYARELEKKTGQRLLAADYEGAITTARTMLEEVLRELERTLTGATGEYHGDLQKQFKAAAKQLRIDDTRADLDDNFKQVVRGLVQIVNGLAPIRSKMSDSHARERRPAAHHARVIVNAARTVATFLIESYAYQSDRGLLPSKT